LQAKKSNHRLLLVVKKKREIYTVGLELQELAMQDNFYLLPIENAPEFGDGSFDGIDGRRGVDVGLGIDGLDEAAGDLLRSVAAALLLRRRFIVILVGRGGSDGGLLAASLKVSFLHPAA
jgi:hypothetical protein